MPRNATTKQCLKVPKSAEKVSKRRDFKVSVLLSAHAERVGVSRMWDSFLLLQRNTQLLTLQGGKDDTYEQCFSRV